MYTHIYNIQAFYTHTHTHTHTHVRKWNWKCYLLSHVWLFVTSWTVAHHAPLSMESPILQGVGNHSLLQGIFLTQGLNPPLLQPRWVLYHWNHLYVYIRAGFSGGVSCKELACQCVRHKRCRFNPWVGRSPGGGYGNPPQYSCLGNLIVRGDWQAIVNRVTRVRHDWSNLACMHIYMYIYISHSFSIMVYYKILNIVPFAMQ